MPKKYNCTINGVQYFRVTRTIGHEPNGKPIKKPFYGDGEKEANKKANEFMELLKKGLISIDKKITINIMFPIWLFQHKRSEIKPSTLETYEGLYRNYIKSDFISNRQIKDLKSINIEEFYKRLQNKKAVHSKNNISIKRIKSIHKLLHCFFDYMEKEGYILKNPCNNANIPKEIISPEQIIEKKLKFDFFKESEIPILISAFEKSSYKNIIIFALATGMRQGEILGLQWNDLDFKNRLIHIIHNLSNSADFDEEGLTKTYSLKIQTPKTNNSVRTIPMNDTVYNMLYNLERKSETIFCSRTGNYICNKNITKVWQKKLANAKLRYRKFHDLRHTFATLMLAKGCDLVTLKELMGHSSIKITEIYLEAIPEFKDESIKKMDNILSQFETK